MTDPRKTEIAVVLDRSGSMARITQEMQTGFAQFVKEQRAQPGECVLSLYRFDHAYEVVFEERPLAKVPPLRLVPRGSTALLDAVGHSIARIGDRLSAKPEHARPGSVVVMIMTDGQENASVEVSRDVLKASIQRQEQLYHWQFMYLGADASVFSEARSLGIDAVSHYPASSAGVERVYARSSHSITEYRSRVSRGEVHARIKLSSSPSDE
jgi:uncharacterized protein YegL